MPSYKTSLTGIIQKGCYALALTALMAAASACGGQEPASPEGQQPVEEQQAAQRPFPTITLPPTPLPPELPETRTPEAPGAQLTPQPRRDNPPISTPTPPPEDEGTIVGIAVGYAQHVPGRRYPVLQVRPGQVLKLRAYARYEDGTYSPIPKDPLRIPIFSLKQTSRIRLYPGNILQVLAPVRTRITLSWDNMVQTVEVQADPEPSQTADRLTGIAVHPAVLTLRAQGETQILRATGIFDDGSTGPVPLLPRAKITFSSTDPDVADVSRDGVLTALYTGEAFVTVHFGPHSTRTPTHALVLIQEEDSNLPDPECLYPHPDQDGMSASANRLKVTLYPEHDTQQTATDVAARLGGTSTGQDRTLSVHFIEFPCPQVPEEQRAQALNELALLLMEQPEVEFIEQMTLRTPAPEPTPSGAPDLQAPTAPESAGDLTVRTDTDPNHIRLQPGERWKLQGIILHQTNRSREELPLDAVGLTFEITPIGDENPAAPYLNLVTVDENGVISADRRAPTSSFTVVASYLGHTAHLRVDIRGGDEPGRMNAFDCTKPGSTGDLMIEFRPNADAADKEAVTQDLGGITRHDYPAFNGRVAEVPCGSPADMTQAVAAALERREVTDAYPYIPTPGDASHELWQPALTPEQKHMTLEVGETRLIEPTIGRWNTGSLQPLNEVERNCIHFQDAGDPTVASVDPLTGAVTAHTPGYATVAVDSCRKGPPVMVHLIVDPKRQEAIKPGPIPHHLSIKTKDGRVLLRPEEFEPINIWATYEDGQELLLQPENDQVEFTTERVQVQQDETGWTLTYPAEHATNEAYNQPITAVHQGVSTWTTVLLRPALDPPPQVDRECQYLAAGIDQLVTADTIAVHMDRSIRTETEASQTAEALGATVIGRSTHQDWKRQSQYLLKFLCETQTDLRRFHDRATAHQAVLNLRHHPENPAGSQISAITASPDITLLHGTSAALVVSAHLSDGTIRPVPQNEQPNIHVTSHDERIITTGQNGEIEAHRTGRTRVEVQYKDLLDWTTVTVLPAPIDEECVVRTTLATNPGTTLIQAEDLREIRFTLQKNHGQATAETLARALGWTLAEETEGLAAAPAWRARREMTCQSGVDPQTPTIEQLRAELSEFADDPRVRNARFVTEQVTLELTATPRPANPEDFGWYPAPPAGQAIQGLAVRIIGPDRIYPSNRVQFVVGADYGNNVIAPLPQELADRITVTSLTEQTLMVDPETGDLATALRPGNGQLQFETGAHRTTVGMTVQEDLIRSPDRSPGCEANIGGALVAHDQAALKMNNGYGLQEAKAVAVHSGGIVIWSSPDGSIHLLERACLSFDEGQDWAELLASRYEAVAYAHLITAE